MVIFSPSNLFSGIACPYRSLCNLTNCIFNHNQPVRSDTQQDQQSETKTPVFEEAAAQDHSEPPNKRRKIVNDTSPSKADQIRSELVAARNKATSANAASDNTVAATTQLKSLKRSVSPPLSSKHLNSEATDNSKRSLNNNGKPPMATSDNTAPDSDSFTHTTPKHHAKPNEILNPRLIPNDPAGHSKRSLLLKYLHAEMVRLNRLVQESPALQHKDLLTMTENEMIAMALDEEEALARKQPQLYTNLMKTKIGSYKKMSVAEWTRQIQLSFKKSAPSTTPSKNGMVIQTNLKPEEEVAILPHLVESNQKRLAPYGYIPTPPTEIEAARAADAVEASYNYEKCERCDARFQVFPDRNEDGLLASNGPCKHHPNRIRFPPKTKGEIVQGTVREPYHPCCDGLVGSPGCTISEYHVFKAGSPARLAAVLPFITTPENLHPQKDRHGKDVRAVSFDCEMAYTVKGMELIRLTAVTWPAGEELIDVLVRPLGTIIDLNSRFSGIWPEHITNAIPYNQWKSDHSNENAAEPTQRKTEAARILPMVSNPQAARALLCSYLTPTTSLIGHAIENDLNAVRLCHPTIIDTVLLFPHPRNLPNRFGLKMLSERHLHRVIQNGGDRGHDSLEDAVATGDLVRVKVVEKWKTLSLLGWKFGEDGSLIKPIGNTKEVANAGAGEKRRRRSAS